LLTVTIVYGLYEEVVKNKAKDQKQRWDHEKDWSFKKHI
jgi:hypothetical protein